MITVHRAIYGTRDSGHSLLASDLPLQAIPPELTGLVDRPPGSYTPDVRWSPFIACAPVGEWWAIWRTIEDMRGTRAGIVQSHVALVPIKQVGHIPDIAPLLNALPRELITLPLSCSSILINEFAAPVAARTISRAYLSLADRLVSARKQPVIYPDEGDFEDVLCTLWRCLWPEVRKRLSCQMAFSPNAITGIDPGVIVITPAALASRWESYPLVDRNAVLAPSGAASLLCGTSTPAFLALRARFDALPGDLRRLVWLERAAMVIGTKEFSQLSLENLRTVRECVAELAPLPANAAELKTELVAHFCEAFPKSSLTDVRALANVDWKPFDGAEPRIREALSLWCKQVAPSLKPDELLVLVKRATDMRYQGWWRETVQQGLRDLRTKAPNLYSAIWSWWGQEHAAALWFVDHLAGTNQEEELLIQSCPAALSEEKAEAAVQLATSKKWSRLHAAVVANAFPPAEAVRRQQSFPHQDQAGWLVLGERLPARSLLSEALTTKHPELLDLAAQAVVKQTELLANLDPSDTGWRALWLVVVQKGIPLSKTVVIPRILPRLVETLLAGEQVEPELLCLIAKEPDAHLLDYPRRDELWTRLPPSVQRLWLRSTATAWVRMMRDQHVRERPEPALVPAVLEQITEDFDRGRLGAQELLLCIQLFPELGEGRVTSWFVRLVRDGRLQAWFAPSFGKICNDHRWRYLANETLCLFKSGHHQVEAMLEQCSHLLSFWDRLRMPSLSANISSTDFFQGIKDVVIQLYPEGPKQKDVWERGGGSLQDLPTGETGAERWHKALDAARKGVRLNSGIEGLLQEILHDFPNNAEIKTLLDISSRVR